MLKIYLTFAEIHDIMSLKGIPLAVGGQSTLPEGSDYNGKLRNMERFNPTGNSSRRIYLITVHDFS